MLVSHRSLGPLPARTLQARPQSFSPAESGSLLWPRACERPGPRQRPRSCGEAGRTARAAGAGGGSERAGAAGRTRVRWGHLRRGHGEVDGTLPGGRPGPEGSEGVGWPRPELLGEPV